MIWLDDNIADHPKFVGLSDEAFGLWVRCVGYCRRLLTDGYVPHGAAIARCKSRNPSKTIQELLDPPVGAPEMGPLWVRVPGGYQIHDYLQWNPSKRVVEEQREAKREAGRAGGRRSGETRAKQNRTNSEAGCFDSASGSASPVANPDPIRSDPKKRSLPEPPPPQLSSEGPDGGGLADRFRLELQRSPLTAHVAASESGLQVLALSAFDRKLRPEWIRDAVTWAIDELRASSAAAAGGQPLSLEATLKVLQKAIRGEATKRANGPPARGGRPRTVVQPDASAWTNGGGYEES